MSDDLVSRLRVDLGNWAADPTYDTRQEAATALTEARAEIERLRIIFGEFKQNTERHDERLSGQIKTLVGQKTYWMDRLTLAESELSTLRAELDASNANHRQMATTMADLARKHDTLRARVREVVGGMLAHSCVADAGQDCKDEEDEAAERAARQLNEDLK